MFCNKFPGCFSSINPSFCFYCKAGYRSLIAAKDFAGYFPDADIYNMDGGIIKLDAKKGWRSTKIYFVCKSLFSCGGITPNNNRKHLNKLKKHYDKNLRNLGNMYYNCNWRPKSSSKSFPATYILSRFHASCEKLSVGDHKKGDQRKFPSCYAIAICKLVFFVACFHIKSHKPQVVFLGF